VAPRLLAIVLMMPVLVVYANLVGDVGGWFVADHYAGINSHMFLESIRGFIEPWDIIGGLIKGAVFGAIIATIGCFRGLNATQGAEGRGPGYHQIRGAVHHPDLHRQLFPVHHLVRPWRLKWKNL
jgi:phospholipid/cholesterol/gamma-HCH transport system permease protein